MTTDDATLASETAIADDTHNLSKPGFLDLLEGTLCAPWQTFETIQSKHTPAMVMGLGWLAVTTIVVMLAQAIWQEELIATDWLAWNSLWAMTGGAITVLVLAGVICGFGGVFGQTCSYRRMVALLSLSGLPWLLYGPLALLKIGLPYLGGVVAFFIGLGLWGWQLWLFAVALAVAFGIPLRRAGLLMTLPLGMTWWAMFATGQLFEIFIGRLLP